MPLQAHDLVGEPESAAAVRWQAWEAMQKWISFRCSRKRGVNVPNVLQIFWRVTGADGGSKVRRPAFVVSERFLENYGVQLAQPAEPGVPAVEAGDDLNFYELAIQYSDRLSKDECFAALREMLFKLGEAASQGRELRVDFGAGHLVVADRRVSFEFAPKLGGSGVTPRPRQKVPSLDPMLNPAAPAPSLVLAGVSADAPRSPPAQPVGGLSRLGGGSGLGGAALSAEEEARLFAEVDSLDPEERAAAAMAAEARGDELEPGTRDQIGRVLAVPADALAGQTLEDVGAARPHIADGPLRSGAAPPS